MIGISLGDKKYTVPFITGRALRSAGEMDKLYERSQENEVIGLEEMDKAVDWLCLLFGNQFTPDDVYDNYPVDSFWFDIFSIYLAVKNGATDKLKEFPTHPEVMKAILA